METIIYPNDFYSFKDGVNVSDGMTNAWIAECVSKIQAKIEKNPDLKETFETCSSGNTMVIVEAYNEDDGKFSLFVTVSKNHSSWKKINVEL